MLLACAELKVCPPCPPGTLPRRGSVCASLYLVRVDATLAHRPVGGGSVGPVTTRLKELYCAMMLREENLFDVFAAAHDDNGGDRGSGGDGSGDGDGSGGGGGAKGAGPVESGGASASKWGSGKAAALPPAPNPSPPLPPPPLAWVVPVLAAAVVAGFALGRLSRQ